MNDIIDIFYNNIIKEASMGRVNCLFIYNIVFNTYLVEDNKYIESTINVDNLFIPTLVIKNKEKFNNLLLEYVIKAKSFYNLEKYEKELKEQNEEELIKDRICIEKILMTLLWSNATVEDFEDPINFLKKRINFLDDEKLLKFQNKTNIGYSEILNSYIIIQTKKDKITNETPYFLEIKLVNSLNPNDYCYLPDVRLGIENDKAYVYAIQNRKSSTNDKTQYEKFINRKLYKIGQNFYENEELNLKDITPSFVLSANIAIALIDSLNIKDIIIPSILIPRWNGGIISDKIRNKDLDNIERINLQKNLTEKFLRTFGRLSYHCKDIKITSFPYDIDSSMHLKLGDIKTFNNELLKETFELTKKCNNNLKK